MHQRSLSALVADPSSTVRLSLRAILQGCDVGRIDTASTISEARRRLLDSKYDLVLCEFHFESEETGQDLLEELREKKLLPLSTLFFMVTAEASYAKVVNVAEETPDDYMLKPVQAGELSERIEKAFNRRQALMEIYEALNDKHYNKALKSAQQMMAVKTPYLGDIVRLAANILFRLGRLEEAATMYKRILATRNPAWAKLGLARVALRMGDKAMAETAMLDIVNLHFRYLPVYNQLAELYLSEERYDDALDITEQALKITPNNLKRLQRAGQIAWSLGDATKAAEHLGRAVRLNGKAVDLDYRSIFHLALLQFNAGGLPDGASLVKQLLAKCKAEELGVEGRRGEWYAELAQAAESIARREPLAAIDVMRKLATHWDAPDFDFAFALDYLSLLAQLYAEDIASTLIAWIEPIALRFDSGRHADQLLVQPLVKHPKLVEVITRAGEVIAQTTNRAAKMMVENDTRAASELLIQEGQRTRNNRLLAAAANAAAKNYLSYKEHAYRQQAETCLAFMVPADDQLTLRLRAQMGSVKVADDAADTAAAPVPPADAGD